MEINHISSTAPLFNKTSDSVLQQIIDGLKNASHHFADDSGSEWGKAKEALAATARIANDEGLGHRALECLHKEAMPLVSFNDFMDAVLRDARTN